jgi:hypothetical protein
MPDKEADRVVETQSGRVAAAERRAARWRLRLTQAGC